MIAALQCLLKMYLAGEFGKDVHDVNPYVASSMYAIDRFASFRTDWEEFYKNGGHHYCRSLYDV